MKSLLLLAITLGFATANAAGEITTSIYSYEHQVMVQWYPTKAECEGNEGEWDDGIEACFVNTADTVTVTSSKRNKRLISHVGVTTTAYNGRGCDFESEATTLFGPGDNILATLKAEDGRVCKVTLTFKNKAVSVRSNDICLEGITNICGIGGELNIDEAKLKTASVARPQILPKPSSKP